MFDWRETLKFVRRKKFPFKFVYSDSYWLVDLGDHVFPIKKYRLIYEQLLRQGVKPEDFISPQKPADEDILLVHTSRYWNKIKTGNLSLAEIATLEIPFSQEGLEFSLLNVGGTIAAAVSALKQGVAVHVGGGFHHAFSDHGEGFCALNDVAIALEKLKKENQIKKALVVDCDVHQGNGTASIFSQKEYVYTFSIHQMDLYPAHKPSSSQDVGLWSGDGDDKYLTELEEYFPRLYQELKPDLVVYLAGADPYSKDQLGGLQMTMKGLLARDKLIIESACQISLPLVIVLAGGYAVDINDTVTVHMNTIKTAQQASWKYRYRNHFAHMKEKP